MRRFVILVLVVAFGLAILSTPVSARRYDAGKWPSWAVHIAPTDPTKMGDDIGWGDPHAKRMPIKESAIDFEWCLLMFRFPYVTTLYWQMDKIGKDMVRTDEHGDSNGTLGSRRSSPPR